MKRLELSALEGVPEVLPGDDLGALALTALDRHHIALREGDVLVLAQKIVSKSEGRFVTLAEIEPSARALELAAKTGKDARLVEVVLRESNEVLRARPDLLIVEQRLGIVMANAGIDQSNVPDGDARLLLLPLDPDASCARLRASIHAATGVNVAVLVIDSAGRAWRNGVVGITIGVSGLPAVVDRRGDLDRCGRALRATQIAVADEVAAAASLLMGQADEGYPIVHMRGVPYARRESGLRELLRPHKEDLFR